MRPLQTDLSCFAKFGFERSPVGIKFLFFRPNDVTPVPADPQRSLCEILRAAQASENPFYLGKEHREIPI